MPYRASLLQNFCSQLLVAREQPQSDNYAKLFEDTELNILSLLDRISNRDHQHLCHTFTGIKATENVWSDLRNFRKIGQELFEDHIKCFLTGEAMIRAGQKSVHK